MNTNKNLSTDRRFSLNLTQPPIAESTCINGTRKPQPNFQWGSPINSNNRSNSSLCVLENGQSADITKDSPSRLKTNRSKIDPRMYADVQSKGLASRIVKYHENGTNLNRSLSVNNLYSKPGHFPVVHLKKTELPYRATRQNLSMTRIAPPEKSMFYGSTLSGLLRSNSIIGLHKSDEELSRENRPILHPPPTESDLAPTRSVLDVLKEISRKRINSDEVNLPDATKKYCNRDVDNVDSQATEIQRSATPTQSFKRQRAQLNQQYLTNPHQQSAQTVAAPGTPTYSPPSKTNSPEQIAKKRLCSYNNDITSSLSSSQIHANKRKLIEQKRTLLNTTRSNLSGLRSCGSLDSPIHRNKIQRQHSDTHVSVPVKTAEVPSGTALSSSRSDGVSRHSNTASVAATLPQRTASEPVFSASQSKPAASKPKLTLFNKDYDEKAEDTSVESASDKEADDHAGIQFVKPKKSSSITRVKNPLIERTQKSKLALMLCGLRGELYQGDDDVVDSCETEKAPPPTTTAASSSSNGFTLPSTTQIVSLTTSTTTTASLSSTPTTNASEVSSSVSKHIAPSAPAVAASQSVTAPTSVASSSSPTTTSAAVPAFGGFNFTPATTTAPTVVPATKPTSPLVGIKLTPQKPASSTEAPPTFSFGAPVSTTSGSAGALQAPKTTTSGLPVLNGFPTGGFSFGNITTSTNTIQTPLAQSSFAIASSSSGDSTKTTAPFTLGSSTTSLQSAPAPTTSASGFGLLTATTTAATSSSLITFGGNTSATTTSTAAIKPFSFGSTNSNPTNLLGATSSAAAAPSLFGSASSASAVPAFASVAPLPAAPNATPQQGGFSFGAITSKTPLFGGNDVSKATGPTTAAAPSFSFGANNTKPEANQFTFGSNSGASDVKPSSFATPVAKNLFGAPAPTPAPVVSTSGTTPSMFGNSTSIFGGSAASGGNATTTSSSSTTNLFAAPSTSSLTGVVKPSFSFGGAASSAAPNSSLFGGTTTAAAPAVNGNTGNVFGGLNSNQSSTFTFGSTATAAAAPKTNLFAPGAAVAKPAGAFTFGSNAAATSAEAAKPAGGITFGAQNNTNAAAGTFTFGSSGSLNSNAPGTLKQNTFSFGASTASNGLAAPSGSSTFSFGSNNNNNNNNNTNSTNTNTVAPFSFSASTNASSTAAKPFTFGSATSSTPSEKPVANVFGTPTLGASGPAKPAAFNFTGDSTAAPSPTPSPAPAFGSTALMASGDRVIRRATRRLHKS